MSNPTIKSSELTLDEAIKWAQEWQESSELAIPAEIVTGLVEGAIALQEKFAEEARQHSVEFTAFENTRREIEQLRSLNSVQAESIVEFQREQKELHEQINKLMNSDFVCSRCGSPKK